MVFVFVIISTGNIEGYFFYAYRILCRVEFQQRGAPHVHMILWLEDKDGNRPDEVFDKDALARWLDKIISANLPDKTDAYREQFDINELYEDELLDKASKFQNHNHTFR